MNNQIIHGQDTDACWFLFNNLISQQNREHQSIKLLFLGKKLDFVALPLNHQGLHRHWYKHGYMKQRID